MSGRWIEGERQGGGGGGEIERLILGKYGVRERMLQNELRQRYNERERYTTGRHRFRQKKRDGN